MASRKVVVYRTPDGATIYAYGDIREDVSTEDYLMLDDHALGFPIQIPPQHHHPHRGVTMRTIIPADLLRELREQGFEEAKSGRPFVNPCAAAKSKDVMRRRGEEWASSVCGRVFDRRSIWYPALPWLNEGEMETLILADAEEDRAAFAEIIKEQ